MFTGYRKSIFSRGKGSRKEAKMQGDRNPQRPVSSSTLTDHGASPQ